MSQRPTRDTFPLTPEYSYSPVTLAKQACTDAHAAKNRYFDELWVRDRFFYCAVRPVCDYEKNLATIDEELERIVYDLKPRDDRGSAEERSAEERMKVNEIYFQRKIARGEIFLLMVQIDRCRKEYDRVLEEE